MMKTIRKPDHGFFWLMPKKTGRAIIVRDRISRARDSDSRSLAYSPDFNAPRPAANQADLEDVRLSNPLSATPSPDASAPSLSMEDIDLIAGDMPPQWMDDKSWDNYER